MSNSTNGAQRSSPSATPVDTPKCISRVQRLEEKQQEKESKEESKTNSDLNARGLDPKYFQTCSDKDYIINPQVIKPAAKANPKSGSQNVRQAASAYFPRKPVVNNNC